MYNLARRDPLKSEDATSSVDEGNNFEEEVRRTLHVQREPTVYQYCYTPLFEMA